MALRCLSDVRLGRISLHRLYFARSDGAGEGEGEAPTDTESSSSSATQPAIASAVPVSGPGCSSVRFQQLKRHPQIPNQHLACSFCPCPFSHSLCPSPSPSGNTTREEQFCTTTSSLIITIIASVIRLAWLMQETRCEMPIIHSQWAGQHNQAY